MLTSPQIQRQDFVDNTCFDLLLNLAPLGNSDSLSWLRWDIESIAAIREAARSIIVDKLHLMKAMDFYPYEAQL